MASSSATAITLPNAPNPPSTCICYNCTKPCSCKHCAAHPLEFCGCFGCNYSAGCACDSCTDYRLYGPFLAYPTCRVWFSRNLAISDYPARLADTSPATSSRPILQPCPPNCCCRSCEPDTTDLPERQVCACANCAYDPRCRCEECGNYRVDGPFDFCEDCCANVEYSARLAESAAPETEALEHYNEPMDQDYTKDSDTELVLKVSNELEQISLSFDSSILPSLSHSSSASPLCPSSSLPLAPLPSTFIIMPLPALQIQPEPCDEVDEGCRGWPPGRRSKRRRTNVERVPEEFRNI